MKIILDTNSLYNNWRLNNSQFQILEKYLSWTDDELCISEIVFEETVRHFRRKYEKALGIQQQLLEIIKIIGDSTQSIRDLNEAENKYRELLSARLESLGARILPHPQVSIVSLLDRDLSEKKPFNASGKGFRDTLIWESVLHDCKKHKEDFVIISNDSDFGSINSECKNSLHKDLISDLDNEGISSSRGILINSLQVFNNLYTKPLVERVYNHREQLIGSFAEILKPDEMLKNYESVIIRKINRELPRLLSFKSSLFRKVSFVDWPRNPCLVEALDLHKDDIQAIIRTSGVIDAHLYSNEDEFRKLQCLSNDKDKTIMVLDQKWNEVQKDFDIKVRIHLAACIVFIWNAKNNTAKGVDVIRVAYREEEL